VGEMTLPELARTYILARLKRVGGNKVAAAERPGIPRRRLEEYGYAHPTPPTRHPEDGVFWAKMAHKQLRHGWCPRDGQSQNRYEAHYASLKSRHDPLSSLQETDPTQATTPYAGPVQFGRSRSPSLQRAQQYPNYFRQRHPVREGGPQGPESPPPETVRLPKTSTFAGTPPANTNSMFMADIP
jgi:hypothetical protein